MKAIQTSQKSHQTTYSVAASYLGGSLVRANNIQGVQSLLSFSDTIGYEIDDETDEYPEVFEYYLTTYTRESCEFLNSHFGLMFAYSEPLDVWVLLVDHYGTGWNYVAVDTDLPAAAEPLGTRRIN